MRLGDFQKHSLGFFRRSGKLYLKTTCSMSRMRIPTMKPQPSIIKTPATDRMVKGLGWFRLLSESSRHGTLPYHLRWSWSRNPYALYSNMRSDIACCKWKRSNIDSNKLSDLWRDLGLLDLKHRLCDTQYLCTHCVCILCYSHGMPNRMLCLHLLYVCVHEYSFFSFTSLCL